MFSLVVIPLGAPGIGASLLEVVSWSGMLGVSGVSERAPSRLVSRRLLDEALGDTCRALRPKLGAF